MQGKRRRVPAVLLLAWLVAGGWPILAATPSSRAGAENLAAARAALAANRPEDAVEFLRGATSSEGLLLRSTARLLLGDEAAGRADLDAALALDPALRQGWLNRAGLAIAIGRYEQALEDLERARVLDPGNPDNSLNRGAVELLRGRLDEAGRHFAAYLALDGSADAHYTVASNYAHAGHAALAAQALARAVTFDERSRVRSKGDPNFERVAQLAPIQEIWTRDAWLPVAGTPVAEQVFVAAYDAGQGPILGAVLDALTLSGETPEARVEVTPEWALLWTPRLRVRVATTANPRAARITLWHRPGRVAAQGEAFAAAAAALYRQIEARLLEARPR